MYKFNRLLVCLDLSNHDQQMLAVTKQIVEHLGADDVYLLHIAEDLQVPEELLKKFPDLIAPVDETLMRELQLNAETVFGKNPNCTIHYEIKEGNRTDTILKWAKIKEVDLLLMGRKPYTESSGVISEKIAKVCHCSMLLVPAGATKMTIKKILVPTDFSKSSKMAIEQSLVIAEKRGATVTCHHSCKVPPGYHVTGKTYEEFAAIMQQHSARDFDKMIKKIGSRAQGIKCIYTLDQYIHPAEDTYKHAKENGFDMIVMGSRGRTGISSVLLGSIACKLIRINYDIPLLIVKDKFDNMGIMGAILKI